MTIRQTKEISSKIFHTLSEETKIRMHNLQFSLSSNEWKDVSDWLDKNTNNPYTIETNLTDTIKATIYWILFYDETDATAFKLRWV